MRPVGYGVKARYWGNYPDTVYRIIDARYNIAHINTGQSNDTISKTYVPNMTLPPRPQTNNPTPRKAYQIVSPFLTGRVYHGNNQWEDDEFAPFDQPDSTVINKPSDETLAGEFYVWEPSNALPAYNYNAKGNVFKWGYNDLKRRKTDLCKLVNRSCGIRLWEITMKANFQPLPAASH
jgi:hypothetical protein